MSIAMPLRLKGSPNLRDLGGHRGADGRRVRHGYLYRSGTLSMLSPDEVVVLAGLNLRTVVDFRLDVEVRDGGADRLPHGLPVLSLPVGGGSMDGLSGLSWSNGVAVERLLGEGRGEEAMLAVYDGFVTQPADREAFGAALRTLADPGSLPLLFHCTAGKDRTGWLAAIVLRLLGVSPADVMADFLLSNEYFLPVAQARMRDRGISPATIGLLRPLLEQRPALLRAAFARAEADYGDFAEFVRVGLGVGDEAVDRLREHLLEPAAA